MERLVPLFAQELGRVVEEVDLQNPAEMLYLPEVWAPNRQPALAGSPLPQFSEHYRQLSNGLHPCAAWLFEPRENQAAPGGPHCSKRTLPCSSSVYRKILRCYTNSPSYDLAEP